MSKTYKIYASKNKNDLKAKIEDIVKPLIQHLIKYYCFSDEELRNKWVSEIYGFYNFAPKLKNTKKFPDENFLFHAFWDDNQDFYDRFYHGVISDVKFDYGNNPIHDLEKTKIFVIDYLHWLAEQLAKYGSVSKWEIKEYLDSNV